MIEVWIAAADAHYVAPDGKAESHGVYWLTAESPAVGKGVAGYAPKLDFWGRPAGDRALDVGAFACVPDRKLPWAPSKWSYAFGAVEGDERGGPPDFWAIPE